MYVNEIFWVLCMYIKIFNSTKHSAICCNTVQLLCVIPMGRSEWYSARLALAAGLNAPQHGPALFLISWSLHNQRHSGQLQISLETWGWLCSSNNDDNFHYLNAPPKSWLWRRGRYTARKVFAQLPATATFTQRWYSFLMAVFNLGVSCRALDSNAVYFPDWLQLATPRENKSQTPPSTQQPPPSRASSVITSEQHPSQLLSRPQPHYRDVTLFLKDNNGLVLSSNTIGLNGE